MAESNFGIMELLQKLLKERGGAISEKEMGIMSGATETGKTGSGYQSWLDKNRFDRPTTSNYTPNEMQTLDPLANTRPYSNPTTPALNKMRGLQQGAGAVSNNELQNFKIGASYVDDGALSGWLTNKLPALTRMGADNLDLNVPPNELRNQINAMTAQPRGAVSDNEMDRGNPSNVDRSFAQALGALSDREQAEIISVTQGYTDDQVANFKRQYLQGKVSPYELEAQSNLGF